MDTENIVELILSRCEEQSKYYHDIAYRSDYKDETICRIVDLAIAYEDITNFINLLLSKEQKQQVKLEQFSANFEQLFESEFKKFVEKQSQVATATNGFPTEVGRVDCNSNEKNTENKQENAVNSVVNSVDNNEH